MTQQPHLRPVMSGPRRMPVTFYFCISAAVPKRIADLLPESRPGLPPHITLVHAPVTPEQVGRLRAAFKREAFSVSLSELGPFPIRLSGTGLFETAGPALPILYLNVIDIAGKLTKLAYSLDAEYHLPRRFKPYHPHATLLYPKHRHELDQGVATYDGFEAECDVDKLTYAIAYSTTDAPQPLRWGEQHPFLLR